MWQGLAASDENKYGKVKKCYFGRVRGLKRKKLHCSFFHPYEVTKAEFASSLSEQLGTIAFYSKSPGKIYVVF